MKIAGKWKTIIQKNGNMCYDLYPIWKVLYVDNCAFLLAKLFFALAL